jgi:transposase
MHTKQQEKAIALFFRGVEVEEISAIAHIPTNEISKLINSLPADYNPPPIQQPQPQRKTRKCKHRIDLVCPECGENKRIRKHGTHDGNQRYRCTTCKTTFQLNYKNERFGRKIQKAAIALMQQNPNMKLDAVATKFAVPKIILHYWRRKSGIRRKGARSQSKKTNYPVETKQAVIELRLQGFSLKQISIKTGIPISTVGHWLSGI